MKKDDELSGGGPGDGHGGVMLRKPTPSRPQLPMDSFAKNLGSSFLAEHESDDSASFSSLLAGAINGDKKQQDGEVNGRSLSSFGERLAAREVTEAGPAPIRPSTARFKSMPPSRIPIPRAPCVTIPPGLSPTTLLDSPVLLSSHQAEPSPTTGTFPLPPLLGDAGTKSGDASKEKVPDHNNGSSFVFKPLPKPGTRCLSPLGSMAPLPFSFPQHMQQLQTPAPSIVTSEPPPSSEASQIVATSSPAEQERHPKAEKSPEQTQSPAMAESDGYNWRKYGQKLVKGSDNPRSYYKCTYVNCPMKKKVERSPDGQVTEIVYEGEQHNHPKPQPTRRTAMNSMSGGLKSTPPRSDAKADDGSRNQANGATGEQSSSSTSDDEGNEDEPDGKRRKKEKQFKESPPIPRTVREPRVVVQTTSEVDVLDDGYRWRKYGQKVVKGNPHPRSYYKCTNLGCPVRKHVERACDDPRAVITTYEGKHNHDVPAARNGGQERVLAIEAAPTHSGGSDASALSFPTSVASPEQLSRSPSVPAEAKRVEEGDDLSAMTNRVKAELQDGFLPTGSPSRIAAASSWSKPEPQTIQDRANGMTASSMLLLRP